MKKIYSIMLLALFSCVTVWAVNVATWDELMAAVTTPNASVTLTANINLPGGTHDFKNATITCGEYSLEGTTSDVTYILQNATFTGMTKKSTPAIKFTAGDSISLENITTVTTSNSNLSAIALSRSRNSDQSQNIAVGVNIDANCNLTGNTGGSARGAGISCSWYSAKIYNYGTINGVSIGAACTFTNRGTINEIHSAGNPTITADPTNSGATNTLNIPSNAVYITSGGPTLNNYGTINGIIYSNASIIYNYSTGTMDGGVYVPYGKSATITNEGIFSQECSSWGKFIFTNNATASFQNGTFNAVKPAASSDKNWGFKFQGSQPINVYVGTGTHFMQTPEGNNAIIHRYCVFDNGVGNHTIEDGYMWREEDGMIVELPHYVAEITHANSSVEYSTDLHTALTTAADGDIIKMIDDATLNYTARLNVNQSVAAKHITLDINVHEFRAITSVIPTLELYGGSLNIINSVPGVGGIYNDAASNAIAINVYGTVLKNCNPKTAAIEDLYTYLNIAEGVNIYAINSGSSAIVINHATEYRDPSTDEIINKGTEIYVNYTATGTGEHCGVANGVRVDVRGSLYAQKYAFKVNGTVGYPDASKVSSKTGQTYGEYFESVKEHFYGSGTTESISVGDTAYSPYIHIYPTAVLDADNDNTGAAGIYASGYARWIIEGTSKGTSGLYIRSGKVTVKNDATIQSTYEGSASFTPGQKSGINTQGNAILINTNASYPGHVVFYVEGDAKISTGATGGAALFEYVQDASLLESISINGGQFTGPYSLAISETTQASGNVVVYGTTLTSEHVADVSGIVAAGVHTVAIPNNNGTTTVIVSKGTTPTQITNFGNTDDPQTGDVVLLPERADANWTGSEPGVINEGDAVVLGELQIISGTNSDKQELTIANNATLNVERLIMNENARIVVEAGGKLIVEGEQGINAPAAENIVLKASEANQATFLINPEVESNRHPMARVQLISKAYKRGTNDYVWQRFGIPAYMDGITRGSMVYDHEAAPTAVYKLDYANNQWASMEDEDAFVPFRCYELTTTAVTPGAVYTFECPLMGNGDAELKLEGKWNYYANSYTAPIDIRQMISDFADQNPNVSATVYLYRASDNWWYEINNGNLDEEGTPTQIAPMQAFIFQRISAGENPQVNYARQIWNPIMNPSANLAPARRAAASMKKAVIEITAADGSKDAIRLMEGERFSASFDNSYDAEKYMNTESFNLFANAEEPMAMLATDNLNGTMLSMTTKEQTSFTMTFANVRNMEYAVRDMLTGTETAMVEGATYMFSVPANTTVEGRFQIVPIANMPTAIENIEETAAIKGIYTLSGQFVGNDYHALPAGVYVVDGKKIVK
jgi:hypothetical protein